MNHIISILFLSRTIHGWTNPENCGYRDAQSSRRELITNGEIAFPYEFPWQVGLNYYNNPGFSHFCGGSILNENWIITAAHCFDPDRLFDAYSVIVGDYNYDDDDTDARQELRIKRIINHPNWNWGRQLAYDIALVELLDPISLSTESPWKKVPICLPEQDGGIPYGEDIFVSGWGMLDEDQGLTPLMHWTSGVLRNDEYCLAMGGEIQYHAAEQVCWDKYHNPDNPKEELYDTGKGDCRGDSGGPSVWLNGDGRYELVGIVSHGVFCGNLLSINVHTEVRKYTDWITDTVENSTQACGPTADTCCNGVDGTWREPWDDLTFEVQVYYTALGMHSGNWEDGLGSLGRCYEDLSATQQNAALHLCYDSARFDTTSYGCGQNFDIQWESVADFSANNTIFADIGARVTFYLNAGPDVTYLVDEDNRNDGDAWENCDFTECEKTDNNCLKYTRSVQFVIAVLPSYFASSRGTDCDNGMKLKVLSSKYEGQLPDDDVDDPCDGNALQVCYDAYEAVTCFDEDALPACISPWMEDCDTPGLTSWSGECDEITECSATILGSFTQVAIGSMCHDSCQTCGYYNDWDAVSPNINDCVTCPYGYEIEPVHGDCRGRCVLAGTSTGLDACHSALESSILACAVEAAEKPIWTGPNCTNAELYNDFSYILCKQEGENYLCNYPISDDMCAPDFSVCRWEDDSYSIQNGNPYMCYPTDGVGSPVICEQCIILGKKYFLGECTDSNEKAVYYPNTTMYAEKKEECPAARAAVEAQLNCVQQRDQSSCLVFYDSCKWSPSAQLCFYESHYELDDVITASGVDCVLGPEISVSSCTAKCAKITQEITSPALGTGSCSPSTYQCVSGDGECGNAADSSSSSSSDSSDNNMMIIVGIAGAAAVLVSALVYVRFCRKNSNKQSGGEKFPSDTEMVDRA